MDIPTIFDILDRLAFVRGMPAVIIVLAAAFVAVIAWDMRLALPALLVHYLFTGLLVVEVLDPRLAVVCTLAGVFVVAVLFVTAWQVNWGRPPGGLTAGEAARLGLSRRRSLGRFTLTDQNLLRLGLAVVAVAVTTWLAQRGDVLPVIPGEMDYLVLAVIGLVGLGLVGLASSPEPLFSGVGLLLFLSGFGLYYGFLDQSILMTVALVAASLVVALVVAYLAQARYLPADVLD
jgi:hypothetical protein